MPNQFDYSAASPARCGSCFATAAGVVPVPNMTTCAVMLLVRDLLHILRILSLMIAAQINIYLLGHTDSTARQWI